MSTSETKKKSRGKSKRDKVEVKTIAVPPGTQGLLGKAQICALLGVSLRTFQGMLASGDYPKADTRLGAFPRWSVEHHNAWIAERCRKGS